MEEKKADDARAALLLELETEARSRATRSRKRAVKKVRRRPQPQKNSESHITAPARRSTSCPARMWSSKPPARMWFPRHHVESLFRLECTMDAVLFVLESSDITSGDITRVHATGPTAPAHVHRIPEVFFTSPTTCLYVIPQSRPQSTLWHPTLWRSDDDRVLTYNGLLRGHPCSLAAPVASLIDWRATMLPACRSPGSCRLPGSMAKKAASLSGSPTQGDTKS